MKVSLLFLTVVFFGFAFCIRAQEKSDLFFDAGGVKINYAVYGAGDPVILVHGWASNGAQNWSAVIKDLSAGYKVIVMDCRGHGRSDKPHEKEKYGVEMVEDIVRLMNHLKIERAHVAGYSMGAMIVLKLLAMHPERVRSAILAGQGGVREDTLRKSEDPVLKFLDQGTPIAEALIAAAPDDEKPSKTEQTLMKLAFAGNDSAALAAAMRGFKELLVTNAQLKNIKTPVLAIYSVEGETVKPLEKLLPGVTLVHIEGANHTTAPFNLIFIKSIREFFNQHQND